MQRVRFSPYLILALFSMGVVNTGSFGANKAPAQPGDHGKIKKCKDADGNWHYGDHAADECAKTKVIEMSEQGTKRRVIAAPPTKEELAERERHKEEIEREAQKKEEQAKRDKLLLTTYSSESDINFIRDRKIAQIESQIKATEETLKPMRAALERMEKQSDNSPQSKKQIEKTKAQIARHEDVVTDKRKEQEQLRQKYEEELKRFRELKASNVAVPQAKK